MHHVDVRVKVNLLLINLLLIGHADAIYFVNMNSKMLLCKVLFRPFTFRTTLERRYLRVLLASTYSTGKGELKDYEIPVKKIRNFSIIAHVDHGKSTLADRLLEMTGAIKTNSGMQVLDKLQVEKERGITVKAQTASLKYMLDGEEYLLNLIDTPGHVDFASEVYRSLAACQGVILLVDANDGVQAQTVANFYLAFGNDLTIIPVINKIDLKNANPERVVNQLANLFDIEENEILKISAKNGTNVDQVLKAIVMRIPEPPAIRDKPLKALIFDSWYDRYKGAVNLIYVKDGIINVGDQISCYHTEKSYEVKSLSFLRPDEEKVQKIYAGQVGCLTCNMKSSDAQIGDTIHLKNMRVEPLPGFKIAKSMVYAGVYPMDQSQYLSLKSAINRLTLNDNAVTVIDESSPALGQGWRLGFLGLLHMEVFCQRLDQEYDAQSILTAPGVTYRAIITLNNKKIDKNKSNEVYFSNPSHFPNPQIIEKIYEPLVLGTIITPDTYMGPIMSLCLDRRGIEKLTKSIDSHRIMIQFILPLNEIIVDFHDELKSLSSGYASFDYEDYGYELSNIVKMDILLNGNVVEELSTLVHCTKATEKAKRMCTKLLDIIPRQQFLIAIQACVGSKVLARENLKPYRKDVTAKLVLLKECISVI
ncbi:translation factor GUF1 homolog, mitochondrial [Copidosoma floridanum]|uniref:translation factor GUF1 homolog, mitochondrial n=1 Tax=Copidosoma floridanum TaxID=29053 RepID=UPI0006C96993|nr:translation factor GUF1 homolog, mitochondrial [Copidosoma floridanum]